MPDFYAKKGEVPMKERLHKALEALIQMIDRYGEMTKHFSLFL